MSSYRYLEANGSKFWSIQVHGATTITRFGKLNTNGQTKEMSHGSVADAVAYADKLTKAKLKKGYADAEPPAGAGGGAGGAGAGGAGAGSKRKSAKAKPRAKPSGGGGAGAGVSEYYECRTGGSHKFWRCVLDGDQTTVTYGKIGSPGNTVVKTYPSVEAAEAAVAKLIREKTKKGYKLAEDPVSSAPKSGKTPGGKRKSTVAAPAPAPATKKSRGGRAASESKGPEELGGLDAVVICITGTCASMKRQAMVELIEQAGGTVSKSVTAKTTHLLLAPGGEDTTKHAQAKGRGITIVTEQWVVDRASADADGDGDDGGDDDDDEEDDEEPAGGAAGLEGVVICITGTCASMKRQAMVDLIAAAGGTVSKSVTARTTHLLLAPGGEDTTKHAQAKGRGLTIVTEQWVVDRANGGGGGEGDGGDGHQFDEAEDEDQNIVTSAAKFRDKLRGVEELSSELADTITKGLRPVLIPIYEDGEKSLFADKFAGTPYMAPGDEWPKCQCGGNMEFFFQCNLSKLPAKFKKRTGPGLLQLFLCPELCGYSSEERYYQARIVDKVSKSVKKSDIKIPPMNDCAANATPKTIVRWREALETFQYEDTSKVTDEDLPDELVDEDFMRPYSSEKMFGWPDWCQGAEYPPCPQCKNEMTNLVFQLTGGAFDGYVLGDCGSGMLLQCEEHKNELGFVWACC